MIWQAARSLLRRAMSEIVAVSLSNSPPPPPLTPPPQRREPYHSNDMSGMRFMRCGESCYTLHLCGGVAAVVDAVSLSNSPSPPPLTPPPQRREPNHSNDMSVMSFMRCGESCYTLHLCGGVAAVVDAVSLASSSSPPPLTPPPQVSWADQHRLRLRLT
jgi:hypothetical protein